MQYMININIIIRTLITRYINNINIMVYAISDTSLEPEFFFDGVRVSARMLIRACVRACLTC